MDSQSVLLAYGDMYYMQGTVDSLEARGYKVFKTMRIEEAFSIIGEEKPNILITGLGLELRNGEFLAKVTKEHDPEIRIIGVSTHDSNGLFCSELGIPHLLMPFGFRDLERLLVECSK